MVSWSISTLAEAGRYRGRDRESPAIRAQDRASLRVRDPCYSSLARTARRHGFARENVALVDRGLACMRNFCDRRRIPSILRHFAHSLSTRCLDRHLWSDNRIGDVFDAHGAEERQTSLNSETRSQEKKSYRKD